MITNMPLLFQCLNHLGYDYLPKLTGNGDERELFQRRLVHGLDPLNGVDEFTAIKIGHGMIETEPCLTYRIAKNDQGIQSHL